MQMTLSTVLKKYEKIDNSTYKILISYFTGKHGNAKAFNENAFKEAIEASILENKAQVVAGTITDYYGLSSGNYKTCLVRTSKEVIPASTASFASMVENKNFKMVASNVFIDSDTNKIWKKTVSDSGSIQLVQTEEEDLEELMRSRVDVSTVVAFSRPFYALNADQFDYVHFYNTSSKKVESGVALGENEKGQKVIASRQQLKTVEVNPHCIVLCGVAQELKETLEKDLKGAKNAADVMQAYINAWYKSAEGSDYANKTEKALKADLLEVRSSIAEDESVVDDVINSINEQEDRSNEQINKEEIEAVLATKFDRSKIGSFAFVESARDSHTLKFTKPMEVDEVIYVQSKVKEIFKVSAEVTSSSEFVNFKISL